MEATNQIREKKERAVYHRTLQRVKKPEEKLEAAGLAPLCRGGMSKAAKVAFDRGERYRIDYLSLSHGLRRDSSLRRARSQL